VALIEKTSISEQILRTLRGEILSGALPAGSRLPSEAELAQRFGTNRNTLREAIRTLEGQHLLQVRQGDGVTVRDFREVGEISLLPLLLAEAGTAAGVDRATVLEDLLVLRRLVLAEAGALAARRRSDDELAGLRELAAALVRSEGQTRELILADLDFYRGLVHAAHSLIYVWLFNTFERAYRALLPLVEKLWVVPDGYLSHLQSLVEAVASRGEAAARHLICNHFDAGDALTLSLARSVSTNKQAAEENKP
jgi:GntR family transcriptional regulator, transcriptional repressor for pyruvate dehydrogenase complex